MVVLAAAYKSPSWDAKFDGWYMCVLTGLAVIFRVVTKILHVPF